MSIIVKKNHQIVITVLLTILLSIGLCFSALHVFAASNPYPGNMNNNCTYAAWEYVKRDTGKELPAWGNAVNWYNNAKNAGYSTGSTIRAKSLAVWKDVKGIQSGGLTGAGHVAYIQDVQNGKAHVQEGNYLGSIHDEWVDAAKYVKNIGWTSNGIYCEQQLVGFIYLTSNTKPISNCTISISPTSYTYDGTAKKPSVTVKDGSTTLTNGTHYTVAYSNNTNAGTGTVTITGKGGYYTGSASKTFIINKKDLSSFRMVTLGQMIYDGTAKTPKVIVEDGTFDEYGSFNTLKEGKDYTVSYSNNVNPGKANVTVTGIGNYQGSHTWNFQIFQAELHLTSYDKAIPTNASGVNCFVYYTLSDPNYTPMYSVPPGSTVSNWKSSNPDVASIELKDTTTASVYIHPKSYGKVTFSCTISYGNITQDLATDCLVRYYDVMDESVPGFEQIYWAADNGITKGYNNGEYFGPTKECTRQEFAIFLWRAMGQPDPKGTNLPFTDVSGMTDAGKKAVSWAFKNGIIQGFEDKTFRPKSKVTREQIVIMLWRTAGKPAANKALAFSDTKNYSKTSTSYKAMSWASEKEIIYGFDDNTFRPKDNSKRNQVVIMLYRFANR